MAIDIAEYKTLYIKTAGELIITLKTKFELLQQDICDTEAIAEFHRAAHSLKSQSLVMGYTKTGVACRVLEHLFAAVKEDRTCLNHTHMPLINKLLLKIEASLQSIAHDNGELDIAEEIEELSKATAISLM